MAPQARWAVFVVAMPLIAVVAVFASEQPARQQLRKWTMQSACNTQSVGEAISTSGLKTTDWHAVEVPSTVVAALVADRTLPDPFVGTNILKLPGYSNRYD